MTEYRNIERVRTTKDVARKKGMWTSSAKWCDVEVMTNCRRGRAWA